VAGPSSRFDDSGLLEYLDTADSDSDFTVESDTDDTSEDAPHATSPAAHPLSDSEEDDMDDENYMEIWHLNKISLFLSKSKNCLDLSICLLILLLLLTSSLLHRLSK
jgi:hypothetical protein